MKFERLDFAADPDAFARTAETIRTHNTRILDGQPRPDYAAETLDSGVDELRRSLPDLSDRDIARVLMVAGQLQKQMFHVGPHYTRAVLISVQLDLAEQLWTEDKSGAAKLLEQLDELHDGAAALAADVPDKRTPEYWTALYGLEVVDADGWRGKDAPSWTERITLPDFWKRFCGSTVRAVDDVTSARIVADVQAARAADEPKTEAHA